MAKERVFLGILLVIALFLQANFNPQLGSFYVGIALVVFVLFFTDKQKQFRLGDLNARTIFQGLALTAFFLLFSFILDRVFAGAAATTIQSVLGVFAQTPILAGSDPAKIFTIGIFIPIVETIAMLVLYEFTIDAMGKDKKILAALIVMTGFMLFHITVKGITGNFALAQTFAFAGFTIWAFERYREGSQAVILHIIVNTLAILTILGLLVFGVVG